MAAQPVDAKTEAVLEALVARHKLIHGTPICSRGITTLSQIGSLAGPIPTSPEPINSGHDAYTFIASCVANDAEIERLTKQIENTDLDTLKSVDEAMRLTIAVNNAEEALKTGGKSSRKGYVLTSSHNPRYAMKMFYNVAKEYAEIVLENAHPPTGLPDPIDFAVKVAHRVQPDGSVSWNMFYFSWGVSWKDFDRAMSDAVFRQLSSWPVQMCDVHACEEPGRVRVRWTVRVPSSKATSRKVLTFGVGGEKGFKEVVRAMKAVTEEKGKLKTAQVYHIGFEALIAAKKKKAEEMEKQFPKLDDKIFLDGEELIPVDDKFMIEQANRLENNEMTMLEAKDIFGDWMDWEPSKTKKNGTNEDDVGESSKAKKMGRPLGSNNKKDQVSGGGGQ